jgi:sterol desaturase/sphingolipid hydroxylase (fatty acid hydroxylase superfamily)
LLVVSLVSAALVTLSGRLINDGVAGRSLGVWPREWPFAVQVVMAFLLVELGSYWMHWLAHVVPFFWRFHRTHHVITAMTAMKALRTHPVDNLFFALARTVPLVMLGAGAAEVTAATSLGLGLGLLAHANLDVTPGPLGLVVNFPRYHAVHHSAAGDEGRANLGCHTVLFDRLFGTFRAQARQPLVIGVTPVGTRSLYEELLAPFVP